MIDRKLQSEAYISFFTSESGKEFMKFITNKIESHHKESESDGTKARDESQRAYGVREVKNHITGLMQDVKKGKSL